MIPTSMTMQNRPAEQNLKRLFLNNDQANAKRLYRTYYHYCTSFIIRSGGKEMDAQDVFQEALTVLYIKTQDSNFQLTASVQSLLYSICWKIWGNKLRKKGANQESLDNPKYSYILDKLSIEDNFIDKFLTKDKASHLQQKALQILRQMKGQCRKILFWRYVSRKTLDEIAEELEISRSQLKDRKSRCFKKFSSQMEPLIDEF